MIIIYYFKKSLNYEYWSIEDFPCKHFACIDSNCAHGFEKYKKRNLDKIWFIEQPTIGEGGFGKVYAHLFHGFTAAYKLVPNYRRSKRTHLRRISISKAMQSKTRRR